MNAKLLYRERHVISENTFVEMIVWKLPKPLKGSSHDFKYRLAFIVQGVCVMRYDNEAGKGDHRHISGEQQFYSFRTPEKLLEDFWKDVDSWRKKP
jgi:Family of unknown function (DUF6516)